MGRISDYGASYYYHKSKGFCGGLWVQLLTGPGVRRHQALKVGPGVMDLFISRRRACFFGSNQKGECFRVSWDRWDRVHMLHILAHASSSLALAVDTVATYVTARNSLTLPVPSSTTNTILPLYTHLPYLASLAYRIYLYSHSRKNVRLSSISPSFDPFHFDFRAAFTSISLTTTLHTPPK